MVSSSFFTAHHQRWKRKTSKPVKLIQQRSASCNFLFFHHKPTATGSVFIVPGAMPDVSPSWPLPDRHEQDPRVDLEKMISYLVPLGMQTAGLKAARSERKTPAGLFRAFKAAQGQRGEGAL